MWLELAGWGGRRRDRGLYQNKHLGINATLLYKAHTAPTLQSEECLSPDLALLVFELGVFSVCFFVFCSIGV
jgi:hypothetical protein